MKIVVSAIGGSLVSTYDPRFGRAEVFCLVETESRKVRGHDNPAISAPGGAGVVAAQFVDKLGAKAVISGAYGPKAFDTLSAAGIKIYVKPTDKKINVAEVIELFKRGDLLEVTSATQNGKKGGSN